MSVQSQSISLSSSTITSNGGILNVNDSDEFDLDALYSTEDFNAVLWVLKNEGYCFDVEKFSEKLVDATIFQAQREMQHKKKKIPTVRDMVSSILKDMIKKAISERPRSIVSEQGTPTQSIVTQSITYTSSSTLNFMLTQAEIAWPKISDFNIKLGLEKIEDYIETWERSKDWAFCVEFLGFESEDCSNVFVYEVEWSKPTKMYPIPQATASVYFALEVFKMVPYNCDQNIEVTYVFETSNVIHHPGKIDFQEKWLEDILEAKIKFYKTVTFAVPKGNCITKISHFKFNEDSQRNSLA